MRRFLVHDCCRSARFSVGIKPISALVQFQSQVFWLLWFRFVKLCLHQEGIDAAFREFNAQIFDIYEVYNAQTDAKQVRLILSDSMYLQEAVLAPELIEEAKCKLLTKGSIVHILEYTLHASVSHELKR